MTQPDLSSRFPRMTPIKSPPSMWLMNGIGTRVYGERDRDPETSAYVTTLCFCIFFVPVFCLRAYRVARARDGWYFLGREPLSMLAIAWNLVIVVGIAGTFGGIALASYLGSPEYKAQQQMAEARTHASKGELTQAAQIFEHLAAAKREQSDNANRELKELIDTKLATAPLAEDGGVFTAAAHLGGRSGAYTSVELLDRGMKLLGTRGEDDPKGGIALLDALRPLAIDTRDIDKAKLPLLRKWVAGEPKNLDAAVGLASLLEEQDQRNEAKQLLLPFKDQLVDNEGARVLGMIYAREGSLDDAYALLWSYVKPRLERLHQAEKKANDLEETLWKQEVQALRDKKAPNDFYQRYDAATEDQRQLMVRDYINEKMKGNGDLRAAGEAYSREIQVVPVTLELGIVMLQRAQGQRDQTARKQQLEAAQDVFLAIKSSAGDTDQYRLFLGQVYYWLGKQAEGRKLFDDFLASKNRSAVALMHIGSTLREIGSDVEARAMTEEAYAKAGNSDERYNAAYLRSLLEKDSDDKIDWLRKANPSEPLIKANLAMALGRKAMEAGNDADAATQYRSALDVYNSLPRDKTSLNELALVYYDLFLTTSDPHDRERCLDSIQQAVSLDPSDPILLFNSASIVMEASLVDILGKDLDLRTLRAGGSTGLLQYLYHDKATREALVKRVAEHPGIARAMGYMDKSMIVSPKHSRSYAGYYSIVAFTRNESGLQLLEQRIAAAGLDAADDLRVHQEQLDGTNDAKITATLTASVQRERKIAESLMPRGGLSGAAAAVHLATGLMALDEYTHNSDPAEVIKLADDADRMAPCSATHGCLVAAHAFRLSRELAARDKEFQAFQQQHARLLGFYGVIVTVAARGDAMSTRMAQHPDYQKMSALLVEDLQLFPESASSITWVLLKNGRPADADKVADIIRKTPRITLSQKVVAEISPSNAMETLEYYWNLQLTGKPQEAQQVLAAYNKLGVALPIKP